MTEILYLLPFSIPHAEGKTKVLEQKGALCFSLKVGQAISQSMCAGSVLMRIHLNFTLGSVFYLNLKLQRNINQKRCILHPTCHPGLHNHGKCSFMDPAFDIRE